MVKILIYSIIFLALGNIFADIPKDEFIKCTKVQGLEARDKCFNKLAQKYTRKRMNSSSEKSLGAWKYDYFVDEFGDKTDNGFLYITSLGKFSNSATTDSSLTVRMYLNDGSEDNPWFRMWEYNSNQVKNSYGTDTYTCALKDNNDQRFKATFYQNAGWDHFNVRRDGKDDLKDLIVNEGSVKIACTATEYSTTKYVFAFDFEGYVNALNAFKSNLN